MHNALQNKHLDAFEYLDSTGCDGLPLDFDSADNTDASPVRNVLQSFQVRCLGCHHPRWGRANSDCD